MALAVGAVAAQVLFIGGVFVIGAIEGHGYRPGRHDVSDLGALTAHHAAVWQAVVAISGALTIAFAIGALRPALTRANLGPALSAWLVALSLPALDNLGDTFFRLDCRMADAGCTSAAATTSWHAKMHVIVFFVALLPTLVAPFALARRMARLDDWRELARPARIFGLAVVATLALTVVTSGSDVQGWTQRLAIVTVCTGIAALAAQVIRRSATPQPD
ncbi:MAG: DUF998 domain-containing protein [Actinobacteria bacterium]|nr:DUF998 domain-containing protein [Actinomycetota bacterium]